MINFGMNTVYDIYMDIFQKEKFMGVITGEILEDYSDYKEKVQEYTLYNKCQYIEEITSQRKAIPGTIVILEVPLVTMVTIEEDDDVINLIRFINKFDEIHFLMSKETMKKEEETDNEN